MGLNLDDIGAAAGSVLVGVFVGAVLLYIASSIDFSTTNYIYQYNWDTLPTAIRNQFYTKNYLYFLIPVIIGIVFGVIIMILPE